jgi:hypothetical protein
MTQFMDKNDDAKHKNRRCNRNEQFQAAFL